MPHGPAESPSGRFRLDHSTRVSSVDFLHTKISLRRPIWSYSKLQHSLAFMKRCLSISRYPYGIPELRWGSVRNINYRDGHISCDYVSQHSSGLYSNMSTTLEDVLVLRRIGIDVMRIDYTIGMRHFKDEVGKDVYPEFFDATMFAFSKIPQELRFFAFDVHKVYKEMPLGDLKKASLSLFHPSSSVIRVASELIRSSGVVPGRTIAVIYRGTDKSSDSKLATVDDYIGIVDKILHDSPGVFSVLIQTDQEQARERMLGHFGKRGRFFRQLPVTRGKAAIHQLAFGKDINMGREEFAKRMMAATLILSQCAYVVTYSGNVGAWVAIYRGTSKNLYQFDVSARLQTP